MKLFYNWVVDIKGNAVWNSLYFSNVLYCGLDPEIIASSLAFTLETILLTNTNAQNGVSSFFFNGVKST